jgi:hypothetical protein
MATFKEQNLKKLLVDYSQKEVDKFIQYCFFVLGEKQNKGGTWVDKNPWMKNRTEQQLSRYYKTVVDDGLPFDGKHITLNSHGVSFDYVAYKNKMMLKYPESLIDVQLVGKDDKFNFLKDSGLVKYTHEITNPFGMKDNDITGCYCVIKNNRGEFLTVLSMEDIAKHRKVAKTDNIWQNWFKEMILKTVLKKACKLHFEDIMQTINTLDNEQNDVEQPLGISVETKQELESITEVPALNQYFKDNQAKNSGHKQDFIDACSKRKAAIVEVLSADN